MQFVPVYITKSEERGIKQCGEETGFPSSQNIS